jgi:hypothetical protein
MGVRDQPVAVPHPTMAGPSLQNGEEEINRFLMLFLYGKVLMAPVCG